jgi:hypothetical protein
LAAQSSTVARAIDQAASRFRLETPRAKRIRMPDYLLPCACGQQTRVTGVQAGKTVRCACGQPLVVPSMRELRTLPRAADAAAVKSRRDIPWEDRHRVAFLLILLAFGALASAGYLALQLPTPEPQVTPQDVDEWVRTGTPDDALGMFEDLKKGLQPEPDQSADLASSRKKLLWGVGIALAGCVLALVGAAVAVRWSAPKSVASPKESKP